MRRSPRDIVTTIVAAIVVGASLLLAGCSSPSAADYSLVAAQLQERVLAVTVGVAEEDWQSASDNLDALEAEVATALARLEVTPERAEDIRNAIDLVRVDVNAALDNATRDAPEPVERPEPGKPDKPDKPDNGEDNKNDNDNDKNDDKKND